MSRWSRAAATAVICSGGLAAGCDSGEPGGVSPDRLGAMVDSLLPVIAAASGLEVRRPVRYALQPRAEARAFIEAQLDEELGLDGTAGMERAYRALGLLPDTLDLRSLLLELLTEQVVGYYDPATDRLYVVEGVPAAAARPVVAHELVHALQDQWTDLDSLVAPGRGNDRRAAAQAAAEGQAMLVMIALQAAEETGRELDPGALPNVGPMMRPALEAENSAFPVFQRSPRLIRETLLFPYTAGAGFVQALFRHRAEGPPPVPFGELLPQSTEQVLEPERAFLDGRDVPTEIRLDAVEGGWSVAYSNTLGQLEAGILLSEWSGDPGVSASGWDGDRYALLDGPAGAETLVWYSVWDDEEAADRVAVDLRGSGEALKVERLAVSGRPVVRVVVVRSGPAPAEELIPPIDELEEVAVR